MKQKRKVLTTDEIHEKSIAICEKLLEINAFKNAKTIMIFMSAFKEPDTIPIIKNIFRLSKKVVVPVTDQQTKIITPSYINCLDDMIAGAYNILEPQIIKSAPLCAIDLVIVPGIAFDKNGNRLGFGEGYYDKFLKNYKKIKIGICYDFQLLDKLPADEHDIPMDIILTERQKNYVI